MIVASFQVVFLAVASVLLYRLTRAALPDDLGVRRIFVLGFAARAFAGQALFWISWLNLPFARGLQLGNGLWFFALDATLYVPNASAAATQGLAAIFHMSRTAASVTFVQALAAFFWMFGRVNSVAILLNLFSYAGTVLIISRWARHEPRARVPAMVAIAAVSISPSMILWSTQPLKDTFFAFLVVAFVGACAAWQRASLAREHSVAGRVVSAILLLILLFAVAGIRWYVAFALLVAATLFLIMTGLRTTPRRLVSVAASVLVALLLSRTVVAGAGPYLPDVIRNLLTPTHRNAITHLPGSLVASVDNARTGFVSVGGATSIRTGTTLGNAPPVRPDVTEVEPVANQAAPQQSPARTPAPSPAPSPGQTPSNARQATSALAQKSAQLPGAATQSVPAAPVAVAAVPSASPKFSPADAVAVESLVRNQLRDWNHGQADAYMNAFARTPELTVVIGPTTVKGWDEMNAFVRRTMAQRPDVERLAVTDLRVEPQPDGSVVVRGRWHRSVNREEVLEGDGTDTLRRAGSEWKIVKSVALIAPPPSRAAQAKGRIIKFVSGVAAVIVPQRIGEWLGLFAISGGRGMMWFTEIDTLVFDAVLVLALLALFTDFGAAVRNPIVWLVVMLTVLVGAPLVYAVTNFGTLFRLRDMLYFALLLIPLAVASRYRAEDAAPSPTAGDRSVD